MSSSAPFIIGMLAVRLTLWAIAKSRGERAAEAAQPGSSRFGAAALGVTLAVLLWVPGLTTGLGLLADGHLWAVLWIALFAALLSPYLAARYVFVPLGASRLARGWSLIPTVTWTEDRRGGACLMAAWALLRARGAEEDAVERVRAKIAEATPHRGAGIVASGLLLAKQGDLDGARAVLASVESIDARARPKMALRVAREWRAVEAAERGDWAEVEVIAALGGARSRLTRLLGALAAHFVGARRLEPARAWALWLLAPRRRHTRAFVAAALSRAPGAVAVGEATPVEVFLDDGASALSAAMRFHAALLGRAPERLAASDVERLAELWDDALGELRAGEQVKARALTLGAVRWEQAIRELERQAEDEVAQAIRAARIPLAKLPDDDGGVLARARRTVRSELLGDVEVAAEGLRTRTRDLRELDAPDEWRDWVERRRTFDRALAQGGPDVLHLCFPVLHPAVCNYAVWLFNVRRERAIANAMFTWLHGQAVAAEDLEAIELSEKNVACGPL